MKRYHGVSPLEQKRSMPAWLAKPSFVIGLLIVLVVILMALFPQFIAPYDPIATDVTVSNQATSAAHWIGKHFYGRDIFSRDIRGTRIDVLVLKDSEFIQAARVAGFSDARILFRHLLPNVISSAVVFAASDVVMCMLTGASMSFLGLGVSPPTPEWGSILNEGRNFITFAWWPTLFPGLFLAVSGVGFSLLGDGLTDFLRTKGR